MGLGLDSRVRFAETLGLAQTSQLGCVSGSRFSALLGMYLGNLGCPVFVSDILVRPTLAQTTWLKAMHGSWSVVKPVG